MRKQTKIAAVVSAAALLALGASITSFAASKGTWMMTDGEWYCYDKDGDAYEDTFCLDNGKEFYVNENGANSHFLRTAGPHSPDSPGHIKRTVLEISRAERGLRPANQY